ncbi:MAG: DEAD/DEAH box helicase [Betaproteobacteria bacterium]
MSITSFNELGLSPEILRAVTEAGYTTPTPIQVQAIPVVLAGLDVMGGAQTGTGKTAGFGLPILQRLQPYANTSPSPARHPVRALILAPTRELAIQVEEAIKEYGKYTGLRSTCVFGGVDIKQQLPIVRAGVEILVATPGRLLDHIEHKSVNLGQVEVFVLDEADRMLDMGFIPDIKRIMALLPATAKRQNLLWSATFSNEIKRLADQLLNEPQLIEVARRNEAAETVTQRAYKCPQDAKRALLTHIVKSRNLSQVLCFVRTKHGASRLARQLEKDGLVTEAIHGDKTQQARLEALSLFKEGKLQVLVATDVAARGLDIDDLPLVVNYELPHTPEDYVHRIGRTGRAGASGEAISFVAPDEEKYLVEIERMLKKKVPVETAVGFDADAAASRMPVRERSERAEKTDRRSGGRSSSPSLASSHARPVSTAAAAPREASDDETSVARIRDRGEGHHGDGRSARERQRDEVYANNPDQPVVGRPNGDAGNAQSAKSALMHGNHAHRNGAGRQKTIPALLMKRRTPEPENA